MTEAELRQTAEHPRQPGQELRLRQRVHALPEAAVAPSHQLAIGREPDQRLLLQLRLVASNVVEDFGD